MSTPADWIAVRACRNWRVYDRESRTYHRGTTGAVRVYTAEEAAIRRADKLNERT